MVLTTEEIQEHIIIKGARQHNLKNVNLDIPRNKLVVLTGVSGSGKSSLAFDTIFAEGQRRYIESLSAYARQFMAQMSKPDIDSIEGLSPAVSISQKTTSYNPRSTVGTVTEIYDFMRVLFARIGIPHCPKCNIEIKAQTVTNIVQQVLKDYSGMEIMVLSPIVRDRKGEYRKELKGLLESGYSRARIDFEIKRLDEMKSEEMVLSRYFRHTIEAVIDRISVDVEEEDRIAESIETAVTLSDGLVIITTLEASQIKRRLTQEKKKTDDKNEEELEGKILEEQIGEMLFSIHLACPKCGLSFPKLEPRNFSFNSIHGACPDCKGLGTTIEVDPEILVVSKELSLANGALADYDPNTKRFRLANMRINRIKAIAEKLEFSIDTPLKELTDQQWNDFFYGPKKPIMVNYEFSWSDKRGGRGKGTAKLKFSGLGPIIMNRFRRTSSQYIRDFIQEFSSPVKCSKCNGSGLKVESRSVVFKGKTIADLAGMSITDCIDFVNSIKLFKNEKKIAENLLKEITMRLEFLINVGLPYLTLSRRANSLSGGESQRIRLGTQIGSSLENVLYILDEPSIGLHNRDNLKLIKTLESLRDKGNTVLVSEHDIDTMLAADWLIDIGPKAGNFGGEILTEGPPEIIAKHKKSITGKYLSGKAKIKTPRKRRIGNGKILKVLGAAENNLKAIDVEFPLGLFICVTGVSGSGKSSLVSDVMWKTLARTLNRAKTKPGKHVGMEGTEHLDKVIEIDQSPIGYTPRSVPATYTKVLDHIRDFYSALPISKARGFKKGRFSFNTKLGRCSACNGLGYNRIEMQFLPNIEVECEICLGKRYSAETLEIKYHDKSIHQVLDMTVNNALEFFKDHPKISTILKTMQEVGLGYIKLGQSSTTLSGGEAQRIKISRELSKKATGKTLYILEEPTVGLHSYDVNNLLAVLNRLVDAGNTVVVVEHNLDVIKCADWIIDLGPEGGEAGGQVIATGTPENLVKNDNSYTGIALRKALTDKLIVDPSTISSREKSFDSVKSRNSISITGARKNNLKNINLSIPKNKLIVITGISGSGKSSLALDTLFAEGQRRFIESLSTYARQFLGTMDTTSVDKIEGLSPAIAIGQKSAGRNPRSTVGTVTEINDYLRLLFATVGIAYCPICNKDISPLTLQEMVKRTLSLGEGTRIKIIAPLVKESQGNFKPLIKELIKEGFTRVIIDNKDEVLLEEITFTGKGKAVLVKDKLNTIELVVDRLVVDKDDIGQLYDSIEIALHKGEGVVRISANGDTLSFSTRRKCFDCGVELPEKFTPKMFSFNTHVGACDKCSGLGVIKSIDPKLFIADTSKSIRQGAIGPITKNKVESNWMVSLIKSLGDAFGFTLDTPIKDLTEEQYQILFYGSDKKFKQVRDVKRRNYAYTYEREREFRGLIPIYEGWLSKTTSYWWLNWMEKFVRVQECSSCHGTRLKPELLAIRVGGLNIDEMTKCSIAEAYNFFGNLSFGGADQIIAEGLIEEVLDRLKFLIDVGLDYLTLNREARTLAGGEAQRIRLANQIGNKLVGVLYVLDEPSIGLHPRDNQRLINTLTELRDLGNSVIVIEHDEATIRSADHIIDLGPGAGVNGGNIVAQGTIEEIMGSTNSITGKYLSGKENIPIPKKRRKGQEFLTIKGVRQNNLRSITAKFPLGVFNCVTGVSGSGKSSLVIETLYRALAKTYHRSKAEVGKYDSIDGLESLDKVIMINQNPIGRTPRSNPATYTGLFDHIRDLFAKLPEAKMRGFTNSRFSYNSSRGRCQICHGRGTKEIEMLFLSNVEIICEECYGRRYNRETLRVKFKGKSIADVLEMTIEDAMPFFENQPKILKILEVMDEVGLGYLQLGQSATTLSGGEAQRVKLASELCRPQTKKTLYILDEPTVGLSAYDVHKLLNILNKLVNVGNTVIIIEHNLDVVKSADWIIDLGPEGGDKGGQVVATGTPEQIKSNAKSITGQYLNDYLQLK